MSSAQVAACRRHGLDVYLHDARELTREAYTSSQGVSANSVCFERELMDHYRLVFEKA